MPNTFIIEPLAYLESRDTMYAVRAESASVHHAMAYCRKREQAEYVARLINEDARHTERFIAEVAIIAIEAEGGK